MARPRTILDLAAGGIGFDRYRDWPPPRTAVRMGEPRNPNRAAEAPQHPPMDMGQLLRSLGRSERQAQDARGLHLPHRQDPAWADVEHYLGRAAFKTPQLAFLDFRKVKLQAQADPKDKKKKVLVPVKKEQQDRLNALRDHRLHRPGSLALSLRRQADLHLSARQESAKTSARGRAAAVSVQHEGRRSHAALPDGPARERTQRPTW